MCPHVICKYLYSQFSNGSSTSSLNCARSALNFLTMNHMDLESNIYIKRLFKFFYKEKPLKSRYKTFWSVPTVIKFLKSWHPMSSLSLKNLTLKTVALIALSSSDRGQSIHMASTKNMIISPNKVEFLIKDRIKTTRKVLKPFVITCVSTEDDSLNVCEYVKYYLEKTKGFRQNYEKLFLSWCSKRPVTKQSIARWLVEVLKLSGINTSIFRAHSFRGASLSYALEKGASIQQIISAGNWSNETTFRRFYCSPSEESEIGRLILESD